MDFDGNVESVWKRLNKSLLKVAYEVCGGTKGHQGHREYRRWKGEIGKVIGDKRRLYKILKK